MNTNAYQARPIFDDADRRKSEFLKGSEYCRFSELTSGEIRDLAVVWSFYSGKIEGNTYTYVETETLLKDDISSTKKYEDAVMLKNLYNAFITVVESVKKSGALELDRRAVMGIHSLIGDKLLEVGQRGVLRDRPVRITGTNYVPPADQQTVQDAFDTILREQAMPIHRNGLYTCIATLRACNPSSTGTSARRALWRASR